MTNTSEVLRRAAELLQERGWTKYEYEDPATGSLCMSGAIALAKLEGWPYALVFDYGGRCLGHPTIKVVAQTSDGRELDQLVWDVIKEQYPEDWEKLWAAGASIAAWNDRPGRTKEQAVAVLEKAAVRAAEAV